MYKNDIHFVLARSSARVPKVNRETPTRRALPEEPEKMEETLLRQSCEKRRSEVESQIRQAASVLSHSFSPSGQDNTAEQTEEDKEEKYG